MDDDEQDVNFKVDDDELIKPLDIPEGFNDDFGLDEEDPDHDK